MLSTLGELCENLKRKYFRELWIFFTKLQQKSVVVKQVVAATRFSISTRQRILSLVKTN
jgi:hypothetical protein